MQITFQKPTVGRFLYPHPPLCIFSWFFNPQRENLDPSVKSLSNLSCPHCPPWWIDPFPTKQGLREGWLRLRLPPTECRVCREPERVGIFHSSKVLILDRTHPLLFDLQSVFNTNPLATSYIWFYISSRINACTHLPLKHNCILQETPFERSACPGTEKCCQSRYLANASMSSICLSVQLR